MPSMSSFTRIVFAFFFLLVSTTGTGTIPNVPWFIRETAKPFLLTFAEVLGESGTLQPQGVADLESVCEILLFSIPEDVGKLSVAKLQALSVAFASAIAYLVDSEGIGSTEQKITAVRNALSHAFLETTGFTNTAFQNEIITMIELFSEEEEDNEIDQYSPYHKYPGSTPQIGSMGEFEAENDVTSGDVAQKLTAMTSEVAQSSSIASTTTSTTEAYTGLTSVTSSAASDASSLFVQHLVSFLAQTPEFDVLFNSVAPTGSVSSYASTSAEAGAYSIDRGEIASIIASAVSQATAGISVESGLFDFIRAYATAVAETLIKYYVLNPDNAVTLANTFGSSLLTSLSSASAASASGWSSAGSQISTVQTTPTTTGVFISPGASRAPYGLPFDSGTPFSFPFGGKTDTNSFDFLPPTDISAAPEPSVMNLAPFTAFMSELLQSPSGLESPVANQRISSILPLLASAATGSDFNASLFSSCLSSLVSQISQSTSLSPTQIFTEAILETITALLHILGSAQLGTVSSVSQAATLSAIVQSVFNSLYA